MKTPIYYFDKLEPFDKWTMGLYTALSVGLGWYFLREDCMGSRRSIIFMYAGVSQLMLYTFLYKSLRNLTAFSIWMLFGLLHLLIYLKLKDEVTLQMMRAHSATPLRNTIPLLMLYQVLRLMSIKAKGYEFVVPNKTSRSDMFDERHPAWLDFVLMIIFWGATLLLSVAQIVLDTSKFNSA